jgi:hypothetical protein
LSHINVIDSLGSYRDNGKQGTKDLLIHDHRVSWDIQQDGRSNLPAIEEKKPQNYERPTALAYCHKIMENFQFPEQNNHPKHATTVYLRHTKVDIQ